MSKFHLVLILLFTLIASAFSSVSTYWVLSEFSGTSARLPGIASDIPVSRENVRATPVVSRLSDIEESVKAVAESTADSVVSIVASRDIRVFRRDPFGMLGWSTGGTVRREIGGGTGIFINDTGLILTNKHVVSDQRSDYTVITADGVEYTGTVLALDPTTDLAVVQALDDTGEKPVATTSATFVDSAREMEIGSFVLAMGNALAEFQNTLTFGVVSGLERTIEASDGLSRSSDLLSGLIQTDAAINPGNSGGPLVNLDGEVIGVNTAIVDGANGVGFAIPVSRQEIGHLIDSVERYGEIKRAFLGVYYVALTDDQIEALDIPVPYGYILFRGEGASAIIPDSPAERADLRTGDVILEADGVPLADISTLTNILKDEFPGDEISLKIYRPDTDETFIRTVELGER